MQLAALVSKVVIYRLFVLAACNAIAAARQRVIRGTRFAVYDRDSVRFDAINLAKSKLPTSTSTLH